MNRHFAHSNQHFKKKMKSKILLVSCILTALFCARTAHAAVIMTLEQVGPDVVATGSGTVDLAGLTYEFSGSGLGPYIHPSTSGLLVGAGGNYGLYGAISGPASFGTGNGTVASSGTGGGLGLVSDVIDVPQGYVSGTPLSGTATWDSTTLAALGVTTGTYTWTWGSGADADSLTLYAGVPAPSSAPEPASVLELTLGAAALALFRRLRH